MFVTASLAPSSRLPLEIPVVRWIDPSLSVTMTRTPSMGSL